FHGADERTHDFSIHLGSESVNIDSPPCEEFANVFRAIDAGRFKVDLFKSSGSKLAAKFVLLQCSSDTTDPGEYALANLREHFAARDYVGTREATSGFEHAKGLAQNPVFVHGEIDDAVGDDHVHRIVGQRNMFNLAFQELNVLQSRFANVFVGQGKHFISQVEPVRFARGPDTLRAEQDVDAATRAKIEHYPAGI